MPKQLNLFGSPDDIPKPHSDSSTIQGEACRACGHTELRAIACPPGSPHYKRVECAKCGAFVRWMPKPGNARKNQIKNLSKGWE